MSAAGRGAKRQKHDVYPTPLWPTKRLLEHVVLPGGAWLEPCAGDGAIVRGVHCMYPVCHKITLWHLVELRRAQAVEQGLGSTVAELPCDYQVWTGQDFFEWDPPRTYDVAITNPPYVDALDVIIRCLGMSEYVAMLLRLNWLESDARAPWIRTHMPDVYPLPNRPSYQGNGRTDATSYAWMVWDSSKKLRRTGRVELLADTPLEERKAA